MRQNSKQTLFHFEKLHSKPPFPKQRTRRRKHRWSGMMGSLHVKHVPGRHQRHLLNTKTIEKKISSRAKDVVVGMVFLHRVDVALRVAARARVEVAAQAAVAVVRVHTVSTGLAARC